MQVASTHAYKEVFRFRPFFAFEPLSLSYNSDDNSLVFAFVTASQSTSLRRLLTIASCSASLPCTTTAVSASTLCVPESLTSSKDNSLAGFQKHLDTRVYASSSTSGTGKVELAVGGWLGHCNTTTCTSGATGAILDCTKEMTPRYSHVGGRRIYVDAKLLNAARSREAEVVIKVVAPGEFEEEIGEVNQCSLATPLNSALGFYRLPRFVSCV